VEALGDEKMKRTAGRRKNEIPSLKLELIIRISQPITDPRVQKALDWIETQRGHRNAAPAVWELLVAALNGELGDGMAPAGESAEDVQLQEQQMAAEDLLANFVID
jgi:hypothetical protein